MRYLDEDYLKARHCRVLHLGFKEARSRRSDSGG